MQQKLQPPVYRENLYNFSDYACPTKLSYYLNKGMTEEEAKAALKERQSTFSLKKCIEKSKRNSRAIIDAKDPSMDFKRYLY